MAFEGGDKCDATPRRARVYFECAEEDALVSVGEPAPCYYEAWFATPSACSLDELRSRHVALKLAAAKAGVAYTPSDTLAELLGL